MARIPSGILGRLSGSISNVTGASVRGIAYIRERVKPANPRSVAQTAQRTLFAATVLALRSFLAVSIRRAFNGTFSGLTGHNVAMRRSLAVMPGTFHAAGLAICDGPLDEPETTVVIVADDVATVSYPGTTTNDPTGSDDIVVYLLDRATGTAFSGPWEAPRTTGEMEITAPVGVPIAEIVTIAFATRDPGTPDQLFSEPVTTGVPFAGGARRTEKPMKGLVVCA